MYLYYIFTYHPHTSEYDDILNILQNTLPLVPPSPGLPAITNQQLNVNVGGNPNALNNALPQRTFSWWKDFLDKGLQYDLNINKAIGNLGNASLEVGFAPLDQVHKIIANNIYGVSTDPDVLYNSTLFNMMVQPGPGRDSLINAAIQGGLYVGIVIYNPNQSQPLISSTFPPPTHI